MRTPSFLPLAALLCMAWFTQAAQAAPVPPAVRAEIDTLLLKLQSSGCEFNRNGSWYSGAEAKTHLLRKLDHLDGKGAVQSTEQFIELGASTSSSSGKAYQVRCGAAAPVDSKAWLTAELKTVRAAARPAAGAAVSK